MAKKKFRINKGRMIITILVIGVIIFTVVNIKTIVNLHIENRQLKESIRINEEKKADKEKELKNVNDPDYIEDQARKQLRMIKPGEQIYIIDQESEKEDEDKKTENEEENRNGDDTENTEDTSGM